MKCFAQIKWDSFRWSLIEEKEPEKKGHFIIGMRILPTNCLVLMKISILIIHWFNKSVRTWDSTDFRRVSFACGFEPLTFLFRWSDSIALRLSYMCIYEWGCRQPGEQAPYRGGESVLAPQGLPSSGRRRRGPFSLLAVCLFKTRAEGELIYPEFWTGDVKEQFGGCLKRHLWAHSSWHWWVKPRSVPLCQLSPSVGAFGSVHGLYQKSSQGDKGSHCSLSV